MTDSLANILISCRQNDFENKISDLLKKKSPQSGFADHDSEENLKVIDILRQVAKRGDQAVAEFTEKFDKVKLSPDEFKVSLDEIKKAHKQIDKKLLSSIRKAIKNVKKYQSEIFIGKRKHPGLRYTPIERVAVCIPGASAPLPSTVIMTAVPAQVAGVKEIVVISPPRFNGSIHPVILAVCFELGIKEVYRLGGVQAVAAVACGTKTIKKVDKIVGPGNKWVQAAKKNIAMDYAAIDSIAGPSEVLIIANKSANPAWLAADMLSQAEHASDSSAIVLTDSQKLAEDVIAELEKQTQQLTRSQQAYQSLCKYSAVVVFKNLNQAVEFANDLATEHLEIQCGSDSKKIAAKIKNAGAIFIGNYTPVAVGDYWAGPSHTLPTETRAKFSSALTSNDFIKSISIIEYSKDKLSKNASDIIRLAETEGLDAHAKSIKIRL